MGDRGETKTERKVHREETSSSLSYDRALTEIMRAGAMKRSGRGFGIGVPFSSTSTSFLTSSSRKEAGISSGMLPSWCRYLHKDD